MKYVTVLIRKKFPGCKCNRQGKCLKNKRKNKKDGGYTISDFAKPVSIHVLLMRGDFISKLLCTYDRFLPYTV